MRRNSLAELLVRQPKFQRILHECVSCHVIGLKPGILETKHGDYGMRQALAGKYETLHLGTDFLCAECTEAQGTA